ncbi:phage tail assembly protein [Iodobacter fluviatilis]|uniref:Tail assembly chaperone E/41/14-like protein n=1 Tax=Iodobacter fluviatilis TaxID=537 RepID=A0A377QA13_9NEIS|nr:phage tail assembly protein [Iodobacter fluviatilis]TCU81206.1 tail assembly chaperone E/41/14-like protein [Iodobacter fluviatilis]STQ91722.1 Uncharacterised protein [Iodobacter fluviatilis]
MQETIKLSTAIKLNDVLVNQLQLREPTVGDQLDVQVLGKSDAEREQLMFARLCDCAPNDLRQLTLRDYKKLQDAYFRLLSDDREP